MVREGSLGQARTTDPDARDGCRGEPVAAVRMVAMASSSPAGTLVSRRSFLAASAAGTTALLVAGCTSADLGDGEPVTAAQVDSLAAQLTVQEGVVAAYAAAAAANAAFGQETSALAQQAQAQLDRLRAASPGTASSSPSAAAPTVGANPRTWLQQQVTAAADSHAAACLEQSGARAALLGSVAAGLRGHAVRLA